MQLTAAKNGDNYTLNGEKMWITNAPDADVFVVYAKTAPDKKQHGITAFIIERGFAGFSSGDKISKLGMRGSPTGALFFDNCKVTANNILGKENGGVEVLMSGLDYERIVLAAGPLGIMAGIAACLQLSLSYSKQRRQFGNAICDYQLIRAKLADMKTALSAARAYVFSVAADCDNNKVSRADCAGAILFAAEAATRAALDTVQILGANGYSGEYPAARFLRRCQTIRRRGHFGDSPFVNSATTARRRLTMTDKHFADSACRANPVAESAATKHANCAKTICRTIDAARQNRRRNKPPQSA